MTTAKPKTFFAGAGMVWRRQRVLWLIYFVTLLLAFLSTRGIVGQTAAVLDHSAESAARLVHGFDLGAITELTLMPHSPLAEGFGFIHISAALFLLFLLFVTGGVLAVYYRDDSLRFGPFFEACGDHFWRFLRLLIYFVIVLIPVGILAGLASHIYNHLDDTSVSPFSAVYFGLAAGLVILLIAIAVKLWFDMAQVIAVAEEERAMHRALRQAARLLCGNFLSLYWLYLRISIVGTVGFALALYYWVNVLRPESIRKAFVLGQLMILWWIGTRLWQRASEAKWYWEFRGSQAPDVPAWTPPSVTEASPAPTTPA